MYHAVFASAFVRPVVGAICSRLTAQTRPTTSTSSFSRTVPAMIKRIACIALALTLMTTSLFAQTENQILELRTYTLVDADAEAKLDAYLEHALVPALVRQGLGPIGVFDQAAAGEEVQVMMLIAGPSAEAVTSASGKLSADAEYMAAAKDYLATPAKQPVLKRVRSELLRSFDCWPTVTASPQKEAGKPRLFELRIYESATEGLGDLKVEMFNAGEVPIFLDCKIAPVFMGQALIGDKQPNLTYMTVYDDDASRQEAWKAFRVHPDWKVLSGVAKYQNTVSKIHQSDWTPKSYSQL